MRLLRLALSGAPRRATLLVFLIAGIAACSGQSCSCVAPLKGGFPLTQRHENGVQTRVTQSFLQYVSDNAAVIVPGLLPGGTTFNIPPSCPASGNQICCGMPQPTCSISLDPRGLDLTPAAPDKLHFVASMIVKTIQNLPITTTIIGVDVHCVISIDTTRSGSQTMIATGDVQLPVDTGTRLTGIALQNAAVNNIDDGDINLNEAGSDGSCSIANSSIVKGFVVSYLKGQVSGLLSGVVEGQLCQKCTDKSDCSQVATACTMGTCIGPDGKACVQEIGIEGKANVGSLLASVSPQTRATIDIMEAAGGYVLANTGLSLGVLGGSQADPHNACVPLRTAPPAVEVTPSVSYQGDVVPGTSTPYHVGIGVHLAHLTSLAYAFWDSGGLCLSIGSDTVSRLDAKTLELVMPSMAHLIRSDNAPMALVLRPQYPPEIKLGKGTFKMVGTTKVVDDPLLTITAKDFTADFYLFVDDRYVRVATLTADLTLPLGLDTDMNGGIVIIAGDFNQAFANLKVSNIELLAENVSDLEAVFPTVFGAALDPLFSGLGPFNLPNFAGLAIAPKVITSTDPDGAGVAQYLGIFADVKPATTAIRALETTGRIVTVNTPPTEVFALSRRDGRVPSVTVEVDGAGPGLEWSYAFDRGPWHPFQNAGSLTLTDPGLWLQGRHVISLRARTPGHPFTLDSTPLELPFFVDSEAPAGDFLVEGVQLIPHVHDRITPAESLRYRVNGGEFMRAEDVRIEKGMLTQDLVVEARDEAGNIEVIPYRGVLLPSPAAGCSMASGTGSRGGALFVLALLGFALFRRRALLALLLLPSFACHHGPGTGDKLAPTDSIGRTHDVQFHDGDLQLVAYDETFGDLAYAKVSLESVASPLDWVLVDGDDPTAAADGKSEYRHGHTAPGPDVGFYASLALTRGGDPRIAYFDATQHGVKYASGPFPFSSHVIDLGSADGAIEIGQYPAISVDLLDVPIVAYMAVGLGDQGSGFRAELRVARGLSDSPSDHTGWDISVVDSTPISCGGRCDAGTACVMTAMVGGMPNTDPALSTCVAIDLAPCATACSSSQACIKGACTGTVTAPELGSLPQGTGLFAHLIRNSTGKHSLVYHERTHGQLRVAVEGDDGKFLPNVIDGKVAGSDMGQFANGAFGDDDTLHITYKDALAGQLLYRSVNAGGVPSEAEVVDNGLRDDGPHPVGASASVIVDGAVAVLYQDQASSDLLLSEKSGAWTPKDVRVGADGSGFSSHLVSADGQRYYTSWVFDRSMMPLGRLVIDRIP